MPGNDRRISIASLLADGLDWLVRSSFLGRLDPDAQEILIAGMEWREFPQQQVVLEHGATGQGVHLIVAGHGRVMVPAGENFDTISWVEPGHLIGEVAATRRQRTDIRVQAASPMRTLYLSEGRFASALERSSTLRAAIEDIVEVRRQSSRILELLYRYPSLRSISRSELERLLQAGQLRRCEAGAPVFRAGDPDSEVYLLLSGKVSVYASAIGTGSRQRRRLTTNEAGWLFGYESVLLETARSYDIDAASDITLLELGRDAFMELLSRNPTLQRHVYQQLAVTDLQVSAATPPVAKALVVAVVNAQPGLGAVSVSYGLAGVLCESGPVTLIDLAGRRSAKQLNLVTRAEQVGEIPVIRAEVPRAFSMEVLWPSDPAQLRALVATLRARHSAHASIVIASTEPLLPVSVAELGADAEVVIRRGSDFSTSLATQRGVLRIDAVRMEDGIELPIATSRNAVRIPPDPESVDRFWNSGNLSYLLDNRHPLGRAVSRIVRVIEGRTVGVALGGGGALAFAHIGLLEAMEEAGMPVDYVAGVSTGAVVGALYATGGVGLAKELLRSRKKLQRAVGASWLSLSPLTRLVHSLTDGCSLGATEIPFYPVALDVLTGREVVISRGTVAEGMRASASFPGYFPADQLGGQRLIDGGFVNNVPASVVWQAGASFILASNVIPPFPVIDRATRSHGMRARLEAATVGRIDDLLRAVFVLMARAGRDRAAIADYVIDFDIPDATIKDYDRGEAIYRAALHQARQQLPAIYDCRESQRVTPLVAR